MTFKLFFLYLLRVLILVLSAGTLACHVAQLTLLGAAYWWPAYTPYILYYVGSIISFLSAAILLVLGLFSVRHVLGDRIVSLINLMLLIAVIVYNSLESGMIPWVYNHEYFSSAKGYAPYCAMYEDENTFKRCWLVNGTWLGVIITGFLWLLLGLYTLVQPNSDFYDDDYDSYDFKNDVPMAQPHQVYAPQQQKQQQTFYYTENELDSLKHDHTPTYSPVQYHSYTPERHSAYISPEGILRSNNSTPFEPYQQQQQQQHQQQKFQINNVSSTSTTSASPNEYERERKESKILIEDAPPIQPPHTHDY